jgi:hypothetical protein
MRHLRFIAAFAVASLVLAGAASAATIVIQNMDGAGEGFNDPTVVAPVGGNPGTTLGAQRLNAFTYAADLWGARLSSSVTILVQAKMDPQTCTASSAILGSAGTVTVFRDFANAPAAGTWYCQALANARSGVDQDPTTPDISATFNSNLNGSAGCLGGRKWYYGYDSTPPGSDIDFISVVTHEIGHGLGFQTFVSQSGVKFSGYNDQYMIKLDQLGATPSTYSTMSDAQRAAANIADPNLRWMGANVDAYAAGIPLTGGFSGTHVRMHAPNPYVAGSSVSHFSTAVTPNEIMEPSYTGPNHNIELTLQLFKDEGWTIIGGCSPNVTTVNDVDTLTVHRQASTFEIKVKVANTGGFAATNVTATMYGGPAWLGISDPNGTYPDLASGASAFNSDTYLLDISNWPGGSFQVNLQVYWTDNCGGNHNQIVPVDLQPAPFLAVAISSFQASAQHERVNLNATFRSDLNVSNVAIYRAVGNGPMQVLDNVAPTDPSRFAYTDVQVTPGSWYRYQLGVTDPDGEVLSQIRTVTVPMLEASLEQNQPNPFNPETTIRFTIPTRDRAVLAIYDANGRLVKTLLDEVVPAGTTAIDWNGRDDSGITVTSGVYFYRLTAGKYSASRKMLLLK